MTIPVPSSATPEPPARWGELTPEQKRERLLAVAGELFARHGIEFPMPEFAGALGVGVGTLYRQFGSKDDVIAALVVRRAAQLEARCAAAAGADDPFAALCKVVLGIVDEGTGDRILHEAWTASAKHPEVVVARTRLGEAMRTLVARAREQGALVADAEAADIGLLLASARAAEQLRAGGARRLARRVLAGMAAPGWELPGELDA